MQKGNHNSRVEILLGVIRNLLDDIATMIEDSSVLRELPYNLRRDLDRDYSYVVSRTNSEGIAFLTTALPSLGKWYDTVLAGHNGEIVCGFKPHITISRDITISCPLFCRTLMYVLLSSCGAPEQARVIRAYRSLFFLYYKMEIPFTKAQLADALQKWKDNEEELGLITFPSFYHEDLIIAREIVESIVGHTDGVFTKIIPQHGPGAVADGENNIEKWETIDYIPSLHSVYPRYDLYFGFRSGGRVSPAMAGEILAVAKRSRRKEAVSRLLFVPKDSRGPRTISCEPKELMFVQQGVSKNLMREAYYHSDGRINFVDQSINGQIALTSSRSEEFATIDLQDASDRVTTRLVLSLFPSWAHRYLLALRSGSTSLPDGSIVNGLQKYAPMGSALCFPIESITFWALAVAAGVHSGMTVTEAKASTYVYGDDIIIRPRVFEHLVRTFTRVGLKVNVGKSYVDGPFRESCGVDAWKGYNVTPFKIKKDISHRSLSGTLAAAICEYSSKCFSLDLRKTGKYLHDLVARQYGVIPYVRAPIGCLSVVDPLTNLDLIDQVNVKWSAASCRVSIKGWVLETPKEPLKLDGLSRLLRSYYGDWEEHDPSAVALLRGAKIRKRNILVDLI